MVRIFLCYAREYGPWKGLEQAVKSGLQALLASCQAWHDAKFPYYPEHRIAEFAGGVGASQSSAVDRMMGQRRNREPVIGGR